MSQMMMQTDSAQYIKGRNGMWSPARLVTTQGVWYIFDYGVPTWITVISMQFGLLGGLIAEYFRSKKKKQALASFEGKSADEIMSLSPKHIKIDLKQVSDYEIKDGGFRNLGQKSIVFNYDGQKHQILIDKDHFDEARIQFERQVSPDKKKV